VKVEILIKIYFIKNYKKVKNVKVVFDKKMKIRFFIKMILKEIKKKQKMLMKQS